MADRVHAELTENKRPLFRQVLQPQKVALEIALVMQVDVEAIKIQVLRQQKFGRRISGVGVKDIRIDLPSDAHQFLHELGDATHPQPARHLRRDFVAHEVTQDGGMTGVGANRPLHRLFDFLARLALTQKLNVLFPRQGDEHAHACGQAFIEKPAGRRMINAQNIEPDLAH